MLESLLFAVGWVGTIFLVAGVICGALYSIAFLLSMFDEMHKACIRMMVIAVLVAIAVVAVIHYSFTLSASA